MDQKSDVQFRAEKEYKNSKNSFQLLLREVLSNSIHAVLIREIKEPGFFPNVELSISDLEKECKIVLKDNGEGFNDLNTRYFNELDKQNTEKKEHHYHPMGQGRLALVYFSDSSVYKSVYKNSDGEYKERVFPYPMNHVTNSDNALFDLLTFDEHDSNENDSFTELTISISSQQKLGRAKTFFRKNASVQGLKNWISESFLPFFIYHPELKVLLKYNGEIAVMEKKQIEKESDSIEFTMSLEDGGDCYKFRLWIMNASGPNHGECPIVCFARGLRAQLSDGNMSYAIDSKDGYQFYLESEAFDERVDSRGGKN